MEEFLVSFPAILALEDGSIFYGEGFGEEKIEKRSRNFWSF